MDEAVYSVRVGDVYCGRCGWQVPEPDVWIHRPDLQFMPCTACGAEKAWIHEVRVADNAQAHDFIELKQRRPGKKKPVLELQAGDQLEHSTGRWMIKRRVIDRDADLYEESVVDAETGEIRHQCLEPITQHWEHGSAKPSPPPTTQEE